MASGLQSVSNYLVPATGSTNAYMVRENFSATSFLVDFNKQELDGLPFRPYGVIIDNTGGANPVTVTINEMALAIVAPAGKAVHCPFPAPVGCTASITGNGIATVVFVDYPVIPFIF